MRRETERERETQFLTMLTVRTSSALNTLTQPTCGHPVDPIGLASACSENQLAPSRSKCQLTLFFKSEHPQPNASGNDVIHIPSLIYYLGFSL